MVNNGEGSAGGQGKRNQSTMRCSGAEDGSGVVCGTVLVLYKDPSNKQNTLQPYLSYGICPAVACCVHTFTARRLRFTDYY